MITLDKISTKETRDAYDNLEVTAILKLTSCVRVDKRYEDIARKDATEAVKREIWQTLYGELIPLYAKMRQAALYGCRMECADEVRAACDALSARLSPNTRSAKERNRKI